MLKHAADLSDAYEYFVLWTGQSNSRPWGTTAEGFSLFGDYQLDEVGRDLTTITIPLDAGRVAGTIETLAVSNTLVANEWNGAHLRLGTVSSPVVGYAKILSNTASAIRVEWIVSPGTAASTPAGIITHEDYKWASHPQVRVLVPYQPTTEDILSRNVPYPTTAATIANNGRGLQIPGFTVPAGLTGFEDMAVFLPFTFKEGIASYGISDASGGGAATAAGATTFDFTTATVASYFTNGYLRVDWHDGSSAKLSWARITGNGVNQFTFAAWQGDGTPTGTAANWRWTAWVPHYDNSPFCFEPGEGFTYPNNDMQPYFKGEYRGYGAALRNRPRGVTTSNYGDAFGEILVMASRLSAATGRRINVVHLGINASLIVPPKTWNGTGFTGIAGWWNYQDHFSWAPYLTSSIYQRLVRLLTYALPNALEAEGNTRTAKCLGWVHVQGESDAFSPSGRQHYGRTIKMFVTAVRNLLTTLGYNPYGNGAKIPFVQPRIAKIVYELNGTYLYYGVSTTVLGDEQGLVNNAIAEHAESDGFSGTTYVDDLPRVLTDPGHYNGVGEAAHAARISNKLGALIDYALSHGSVCLTNNLTATIEICNLALAHIGETDFIESLDDGSAMAALCKRYLPQARDTLLQARVWGFALRRKSLVEVQMPEETLYSHFGHCYVLPPEALNAFRVIPIATTPSEFDIWQVTTLTYSSDFVASLTPTTLETEVVLPVTTETSLPEVDYAVEQSPFGHRYIFTNEPNATLRYVARVVDASLYSPAFATALSWYLASMLASAHIKGSEGESVSARCLQKAGHFVRSASASDAMQRTPAPIFDQIPKHLADR